MNLKDYREKELRWYILANILILLLMQGIFRVDSIDSYFESIKIISKLLRLVTLSTFIFCFILVTESLFPSNLKFTLLYFGVFHLPGETIFTEIKNNPHDKRFTKEQANNKYKDIYDTMPTDKKEKYIYENSKWYSLYTKYRDINMIEFSNRDYLLCRDIYISNITLIVLYLITTFWFQIITFDYEYLFYLLFMLIITNIGTQQKGRRFAYNVIALDLQDTIKGK